MSPPPATATVHVLAFDKLSPADFERLCLWLVRREGYDLAEHLGEAGSEQGRDVVAWRQGRRVAFQCKRVKSFTAADATGEIDKIRGLPADRQPDELVFVVTVPVRAATREAARRAWGGDETACRFWSGDELDERVKRHHDIVDEFFRRLPGAEPPARPRDEVGLLAEVRRFCADYLPKEHGELPRISVPKRRLFAAVDHPRSEILHRRGEPHEEIEAGVTAYDVLTNLSGWQMLILGEAGSGKSVELVELARRAAAAAEQDPEAPIPVVLQLNRWRDDRPFTDWLSSEIAKGYRARRKVVDRWLGERRLLLLLDELDGLGGRRRGACIQAINAFVGADASRGLVVCCRSREYDESRQSGRTLELGGALELRPLPAAEVEGFLDGAGETVAALRAAWRHEAAWQELLVRPLFLGAAAMAFAGTGPEELREASRSAAGLRQRVFHRYVDRAFERREQRYPRPRTEAWLSFLARRPEPGQDIFIDELQPSWLGSAGERRLYALVTRTSAGLLVGLSTLEPAGVALGALSGLGAGAVDAWHLGSGRRHGGRLYVQTLAAALAWAATRETVGYQEPVPALLVAGMLAALFILQGRGRGLGDDVRPVDRLTLSGRGVLWGLLPGLLLAAASLTLRWLNREYLSWFVLWVLAFPSALLGALVGGLRGQAKRVGRTRPNQGIVHSSGSALTAGLLPTAAVLYPLLLGLSQGAWRDGLSDARSLGVVLLPLAAVLGLAFGGLEVIRHSTLRLTLWVRGRLPWRLVRFLEAQTNNVLLVRRGPAYSFFHAYLRDHFRDRRGAQAPDLESAPETTVS